ncbi:MAG: hypothetical protein FD174_2349 [Geobacteraceae bacterium]|nr:MAG: hypothetical protein FD174_2349 [Geobacteraceae bacterium]
MRRSTKSLIAILVLSGSALLAQGSPADEIALASVGQTDLLNVSGLGQAVSNENLGDQTGRQEIKLDQMYMQLSTSDQKAQADSNSIINSAITNGANAIGGSAFSQASGIITVIQNSGNQVLIQNDMIMNLTVK